MIHSGQYLIIERVTGYMAEEKIKKRYIWRGTKTSAHPFSSNENIDLYFSMQTTIPQYKKTMQSAPVKLPGSKLWISVIPIMNGIS